MTSLILKGRCSKKEARIDKIIGKQVKLVRSAKRMSQGELGGQAKITTQQIQKYEYGINKISASRLHTFSKILEVPITFFFRDYEEDHGILLGKDTLKLIGYFNNMPEYKRATILNFAKIINKPNYEEENV